ncbi:MAG: signal recognition particle protein [Planctomyces sp.]|nr:signal recognition particle protein [Planctomyces sp.]MBA4119295.1 signal recognition particle protein [Isosphaera sp.]
MFERLSEGFSSVLRTLSGKGQISESNVRQAMAQVREALLEADVALEVVEGFTAEVLRDAVGRDVTKSLQPGQEFIGIVYERLVELLGDGPAVPPEATPEEAAKALMQDGPGVTQVSPGPTVVMMAGLQGSGKTTTCGKLAAWLKKRGRSSMLVAADLQRPAAVEQLQTVAEQVAESAPGAARVLFYGEPDQVAEYGKAVGAAVGVCQRGIAAARAQGVDTVILDTAGRLHVNDALMDELSRVAKLLGPHQIFLVIDAMTGQDAVRSAKAFHQRLEVDGLILTKFDSDTRGGAALSVRRVTGAQIRFIGVGEKIDALEEFHAARMASRILGMGDVVSLVQRAREQVSEEEAKRLEEKLARGEMTMDDFLGQMRSIRRMGPLKQVLGLLPGVGSALKDLNLDDSHLDRIEGMVNSMTKAERKDPELISFSRRRRIAGGSGTKPEEVGALVKQFQTISTLSKRLAGMSAAEKVRTVKQLGASQGAMTGMGSPLMRTRGSTHTESVKNRFKKRR